MPIISGHPHNPEHDAAPFKTNFRSVAMPTQQHAPCRRFFELDGATAIVSAGACLKDGLREDSAGSSRGQRTYTILPRIATQGTTCIHLMLCHTRGGLRWRGGGGATIVFQFSFTPTYIGNGDHGPVL